jgi:hypothetical protein
LLEETLSLLLGFEVPLDLEGTSLYNGVICKEFVSFLDTEPGFRILNG